MTTPSYEFLGLPQAQWAFINDFAGWISAVGTVAAVWVSLWLARREPVPSAKVSVAEVLIFGDGSRSGPMVSFTITNTGSLPLRVSSIGWEHGPRRKKRFAMQNPGQTLYDSPMPIELSHGQGANWFIEIDRDVMPGETWEEYFAKRAILPDVETSLKTLRGTFHTSVGKSFKAKPSTDLIKRLRAAAERLKAQGIGPA